MSQWWNWHNHALPKEVRKIYIYIYIYITRHVHWVLLTSIIFHWRVAAFTISYDLMILVHDFHKSFLHVTQILLYMCSRDQSLATLEFLLRSYHNLNFIKIWPEIFFLVVVLIQVQQFETGAISDLEVSPQCGKRMKTKS